MSLVTSVALLAVFRLTRLLTGRTALGGAVTLLTGLYPVWFAQSTLAHADLLAAAATLWGITFLLPANPAAPLTGPVPQPAPVPTTAATRRMWLATLFFALAALAKETAIITPLAAFLFFAASAFAHRQHLWRTLLHAAPLLLSLLPLCCWYAYHFHATGFVFGNPEYLRYNATATLTPLRILVALLHRLFQAFAHMNMFVPVLCACAALFLDPQRSVTHLPPAALRLLAVIILAHLAAFSVLGGALLTRYLLPLYPLILLFCVLAFYTRLRLWYVLVAFSAGAFILGLFINPPYRFAPEDNLSYRDMIVLHQSAIQRIRQRFPSQAVLTAWPATDELTKPELGYVRTPIPVVPISNFSREALVRFLSAPPSPGAPIPQVVFAFSTKYDPPELPFGLAARNQALDRRFFDYHQDLAPAAIGQLVHGQLVWQRSRQKQWAALLSLDHPRPTPR